MAAKLTDLVAFDMQIIEILRIIEKSYPLIETSLNQKLLTSLFTLNVV